MRVPPEEFEAYIAPGETVVEAVPGTIVDGSYRSEGAIGLTDRRLLFVADGDRFLDVAHGCVSSIRSRPRTAHTLAGIGYPLLVAVGAVVAVAGLLGAAAFDPSPLGFGLAATSVAGFVAAEYGRRSGLAIDLDSRAVLGHVRRGAVGTALGALGDAGLRRRGPEAGDSDALVLGIGLASLFALVGLVALAGTLLVLPPILVSLVGLVTADYGYRNARRLDVAGGSRRFERDVRIHLVDGRVVGLRVDAADRIDRALCGVARAPGRRDAGGSDHSPATAPGTGR